MADAGNAGVIREVVAIFAIFFNELGVAHFFEGFFGRQAGELWFHGAEFVNLEFAVVLRETLFGVDGGVAEIGEFDDEPNKEHWNKRKDEHNDAEKNVEKAFEITRVAGEWCGVDAERGGVADEFEFAELRGEGGFAGDKIVDDVAIDGLLIDVFGLALVGLKNDVGLGVAKSVFDGGVLFVQEVFREVFARGNDADELIAGLGGGGNVVGEVVGVFVVPYDDGAKGAVAVTKTEIANEPEDGAVEDEEEEAKNKRVEGDGANRE